ncbi:phospholipase B1, membrane-associated-like [Schistocerca serialis cubense]|uniref:phospholipase B1, membrane-associated-like n=1 Tax=Schistocerca serialis cubense TaxID=2023355 RepID=UPI00214EC8D3|nr:phospholipase B1, membrane-associated-like [Schistocerca serialis cubense]
MRVAEGAALVLCCWAVAAHAQSRRQRLLRLPSSPRALLGYYEALREAVAKAVAPRNRLAGLRDAQKLNMLQPEVPSDRPFPCDTRLGRSPSPPDSVHRLRPGDIDVIAALGDSLTAGYGNVAANLLQVAIENRGMSWSIGGEGSWRQFLTLPNILKEFNPRLVGYSLNDSLSHQHASQFNVAEGGAMSRDLPWQANLLVRRMRAHPQVDVSRHWKMVTILIGGNDFCIDMCYEGKAAGAVESHRRELMETLDYLRANLPRTIVNLVVAPHLRILVEAEDMPGRCWLTHHVECPCLMGSRFLAQRQQFFDIMSRWQQVDLDVAIDKRYAGLEDFAVVAQPFLLNASFLTVNTSGGPRTDFTVLSQDCFHLSQKGDALAANALWNNLMEPVGNKSLEWQETFSRFLCPTQESPYIYTNENSRRGASSRRRRRRRQRGR